MVIGELHRDLQPWEPLQCELPATWIALASTLGEQIKGSLRTYVLGVKYEAANVGRLLHTWGLPWDVVMSGYLWEYVDDQEPIQYAHLNPEETDHVLKHMNQAKLYTLYIEHDTLPPLLTPPYEDLGALLIAVAIYYEALHTLAQRGYEQIYRGQKLQEIENVGYTLLNITKRLGMWDAKREIEDCLEQLRSPRRFGEDQQEHSQILAQDTERLERARHLLTTFYQETTRQPVEVVYSPCGVAGLKRRQQDAHTTATTQKTQLTGFDLVTFDVIVPSVQHCYTALGVLSQIGRVQDRVNDLIANPKPNGCSHIALGLVLHPHILHSYGLDQPEAASAQLVCQLQITTQVMQAIMRYGCLYPDCYQLYSEAPLTEQEHILITHTWNSAVGKVFQTITEGFPIDRSQSEKDVPIIVYDKNRNTVRLPRGATALDFAFALNSEVGERAVEAFINNRKAPLYRVLDAGDVVEIRTSNDIQTQDYWTDESYAKTELARKYIGESLTRLSLDRKGYNLLRQALERQNYFLSPDELGKELRRLVKQKKLGTVEKYLERLSQQGQPPYNSEWAAEQIIRQIGEHKEALLAGPDHTSWIAALDRSVVGTDRAFHRQHLCHWCQPQYPRDTKILGLRKPNGEVVVHKQTCPYLLGRNSSRTELLPMIWQKQSPPFRVAFFVLAQDRTGLIYDLTRELRRHNCVLLSIHAETLLKFKEAYTRFVIEAYKDEEVLTIRQQLSLIEGVTKVEFNAASTAPHVYDRLQKLRGQQTSAPAAVTVNIGPSWEEIISTLQPRNQVLKNPYEISRPAAPHIFVGRTQELQTMQRELCADEHGKAVILFGPRRSGKSSLCKVFLERHVLPPFWGVLFSLQNVMQQTEEVILMQLAEKIGSVFEDQLQQSAPRWDDYHDLDAEVRFRRMIQDCISRVPGTRLVLALDEFGGALEGYQRGILDYRFFTFWKELMNEVNQLSLIFALPTSSHYALLENFANVFSFALPLPMAFLDRENAERLLAHPLHDQHIAVHPSTLARAVTLTGGNPYYMTLIGHLLVNYLNQDVSKHIVTVEDLHTVVDSLLIEQKSSANFDYVRRELQSNEELRLLEGLIELTRQSNQPQVTQKKIATQTNLPLPLARKHLQRLENGLILQQTGSPINPSYSFMIELVRLWLSRHTWFFLSAVNP